ncbi:MAG: hypothetical protein K8H86_09120 [Ignavibacteriaceae bacterium]|nr:hypothetical protein [Ignavibacteriaceae bacterium]
MRRDNNLEKNRFKNFSAEKKLDLSIQLRNSAFELKKAALKEFHPSWSDGKVNEEVRKIFLYART